MIKYIGKSLLIEEGKRILVIGDLHLGYEQSLREGGVFVVGRVFDQILNEIKEIFDFVGNVDEVVLLGDLKNEIGRILRDERREIGKLFEFLFEKSKRVTVIKGNHDVMIEFMNIENVKIIDYYIVGGFCFLHGDRDFKEIYDKKIKYWVMGHAHPAIVLKEGIKEEKYKCFLVGEYMKKKIIILPSFFPGSEGSDPRESGVNLAWDFDLGNFSVFIVNGLDTLDFGKLKKL